MTQPNILTSYVEFQRSSPGLHVCMLFLRMRVFWRREAADLEVS
jgi:hypothetical protein